MILRLLLWLKHSSPWRENYDELRENMVLIIAILLVALGIFCGAITVTNHQYPNYEFLLAMSTVMLGLASASLSHSHVNLARPVLAVVGTVLFLAGLRV
ncbi:MAG TPA: hypothetical protein VGK81_10850, partial [Anaerolineae bacterium]